MDARRTDTTSSSVICAEVLVALERIFALEGPDEPDLGLNVTYLTSCRMLTRFARAQPWVVPRQAAEVIRHRLRRIESMSDPRELEMQLLSFPAWVIEMLDRRRADRGVAPASQDLRRRAGDHVAAA